MLMCAHNNIGSLTPRRHSAHMAGENPIPGVNERGLFCPFSLAPGTSAFRAAPTKSRLFPTKSRLNSDKVRTVFVLKPRLFFVV